MPTTTTEAGGIKYFCNDCSTEEEKVESKLTLVGGREVPVCTKCRGASFWAVSVESPGLWMPPPNRE